MQNPAVPVAVSGLHHITMLASDPVANHRFYAGLLGLRMVKRTVNFDAPEVYHLYFGDEAGSPGTLLTFFPFPGLARGRVGVGQASGLLLAVPAGAGPAWRERLRAGGAPAEDTVLPTGEAAVRTADPDGLPLHLVPTAEPLAFDRPWTGGGVGPELAVRGVRAVVLNVRSPEMTARFVADALGWTEVARGEGWVRLAGTAGPAGGFLDVTGPTGAGGRSGAGTVHHVALRVGARTDSEALLRHLPRAGAYASPLLDRSYFESIYFREPNGVLLEVATDGPGFATDEAPDALGQSLRLPPQHEPLRAQLERSLVPLA